MSTTTTTVTRESAMIPDQQQSSLDSQARRHVKTTVNYWKSDADRTPAMDKSKPFLDRKMAFVRYQMDHEDVQPVLVHDLRGRQDDFTLDKQGFQLCRRQIQTQSFTDEEHIKDSYYKEVETLLKETTGAIKIHIYDHHIRDLSLEASLIAPPIEDSLDLPGPVRTAHIDDTPASARLVIRKSFPPSEATHLLANPFCLINVWRPLKPVHKEPPRPRRRPHRATPRARRSAPPHARRRRYRHLSDPRECGASVVVCQRAAARGGLAV